MTAPIYLYRQPPSDQSRVYQVTQLRPDDVHCRESAGPGPVVSKIVPVTGVALADHYGPIHMCFLPIYSRRQVRWMYQPGSRRRKVTQDFSSTFLLRCMPLFCSREGFSRSFPSSTAKSNFVYTCWAFLFFIFYFLVRTDKKSQLPGFELMSQRVRRLRGNRLSNRGDRHAPLFPTHTVGIKGAC